MLADVGSVTTNSSSDTLARGYSPNYQGIYIRTPSGIQTRLFDYIAPLTSSTRVDTVDIDRDGDKDYIYIIDGVLYAKYSHINEPNRIVDTTTKISDISSRDPSPYIPDYFYEDVSTPRNLNFSFVSASETEREWRAEFYDRYTEWDAVDIGKNDPRTAPKTTIDMFLTPTSLPTKEPMISRIPVARSLTSV